MFQQVNATPNPLAKEELNLLAKLMGRLEDPSPGNTDSGFRVNLFATDEEEEWVLLLVCVCVLFDTWSNAIILLV